MQVNYVTQKALGKLGGYSWNFIGRVKAEELFSFRKYLYHDLLDYQMQDNMRVVAQEFRYGLN